MAKKLLVERRAGREMTRSIEILEKPEGVSSLASPLAWRILTELSHKPAYPNELARRMRVHEQKIYYHTRRLLAAGLVEVVGETRVRGASAKMLAPTADAFGVELPSTREGIARKGPSMSPQLRDFLSEFLRRGAFDGSIVVGAPTPHGPYDTSARDGYYTSHLAMFLGQFCSVPQERFIVKLDTEVRAERKEKRNLILVGGPIVNTVVADLAASMAVTMKYAEGRWAIVSTANGRTYTDSRDVLIAKVRNPWDDSKRLIVLAGLKAAGTKTCIIALTQFHEKVLKDYDKNRDFYRILRGLDRDGDGNVDDVEILE
ncbi:MAG: S-layer protein [Candidatus Aenigmatarchaeota archaeon]|nr:MAG: S-layer protein [Candidatus Aenigmarchaeota archaeon]